MDSSSHSSHFDSISANTQITEPTANTSRDTRMGMNVDYDSNTGNAIYLKACVTCKKPESVYIYNSFKNCLACREKNRIKKKEVEERKQRMEAGIRRIMKKAENQDDEEDTNNKRAYQEEKTRTGATKRKALEPLREHVLNRMKMKEYKPKSFRDLDEKEKRVAMKAMKSGLMRKTTKERMSLKLNGDAHISPVKEESEYQTATALYDFLKQSVLKSSSTSSKNSLMRFRGFHSIVTVSTIDNQKRAEMVANDLRKIVRVPFEYTKPDPAVRFNDMARTLTFKCTCLGHELTTPAASVPASPSSQSVSAPVKMKGTQGDLIRQARARANLAGLSAQSNSPSSANTGTSESICLPKVCGGTVKITVVNDDRHPLGIPGQRIEVVIKH